jgi:hypothetical protein
VLPGCACCSRTMMYSFGLDSERMAVARVRAPKKIQMQMVRGLMRKVGAG